MTAVDYIVIGTGPGGSVVASRLAEIDGAKILVFEQGPRDRNPYIHIPVTYYKTAKGSLLSRFKVENSTPARNAAFPEMVQGRVLGGASSVNAMVYMRGVPHDYDRWAAAGCVGWSYEEVLPYFRKAEHNERFAGKTHGTDGPLWVSDQRATHDLTKRWLQACQSIGIPFNPDFNSGIQAGVGLYQVMMRDGRRCSAAAAYLRPAEARGGVTVWTGKRVIKIIVEEGRARGVEYVDNGRVERVYTSREVIVSAGAINSPHLLMVSGIGPAASLRAAGVNVVHDLPGVGQNLQDHVDVLLIYDLTGPYSYDKYKKTRWQLSAALQYLLFRSGPATSNVCEGGLCWWGDETEATPDLQYHFLPGAGVEEGSESTPSGNGCTVNLYQMRPRSRGEIRLRGPDIDTQPIVDPRYMSDSHDVECLGEGVRIGMEIMSQDVFKRYIKGIHRPNKIMGTKQERQAFVRETGQGALHPCGTCKMGTDELAVVDPQFRVRGIDGLRVVDTSVIPFVPSGNLTAPTIMMAERAADFIKGEMPAPPR